jgi:MFS family permease
VGGGPGRAGPAGRDDRARLTAAARVPAKVVAAVLLGTTLNPLNSSIIALALVDVSHDFDASLAAAGALVVCFYVVGALAQPAMGRLADRFGPRRVFVSGLSIVVVASLLAPLAPSLAWLVVARSLLAFGTAASFPSGMAMIRAVAGEGPTPTGTLGAMSIAANGMAALGPVVGGLAVALAGWQAVFLVNVPLALAGIALAQVWLPALPGSGAGAAHGRRPTVALLGLRTRRGVFARFVAVTLAFYGVVLGLPVWLEEARGLEASTAGLIMAPVAGLSMITTPIAARFIRLRGAAPSVILGAACVVAGAVPMLAYGPHTALAVVVAAGAVLGAGLGFANLGLQTALYEGAPPAQMGAAGGLFQTCRYIGAILATVIMGAAFADTVDATGLHIIAAVTAGLALLAIAGTVAGIYKSGSE